MFKRDPQVHVVYDDDKRILCLYVDESTKAQALGELLPAEKLFGNVKLTIEVVPGNVEDCDVDETFDIYARAFYKNPALSFVKPIPGVFANNMKYVVFRKEVVQYWVDDLGDIYGQRSTLYQNIAMDIFEEQEGVFFCTDAADPEPYMGNPLGEWP